MDFAPSDKKVSTWLFGFTRSGSATCSHFATTDKVVPWMITELKDTKNTILKIKLRLLMLFSIQNHDLCRI